MTFLEFKNQLFDLAYFNIIRYTYDSPISTEIILPVG